MAKYLPKSGIGVTVLAGKIQEKAIDFQGNVIAVKDINQLSKNIAGYFWRAYQKSLRSLGFYRGIHSYWLSQALSNSVEIMSLARPEMILASYPCVEALEIGIALSKKYGLPLVADFRDGLLFEPLETRLLKTASVHKYYQQIERQVASSADLISSISDPISNYFYEKYGCLNVLTLPNGFDEEEFFSNENLRDYSLDENLINIIHTGRVGLSRESSSMMDGGISALSAALNILIKKSPDLLTGLRIHFVGSLSKYELGSLETFIKLGIVKIWGHLPRSVALSFQRRADYLLLITVSNQAGLATGKIFEYLAANKKILALTCGTEAEKIIKETGAGVAIPPDDPVKIADILELVLDGIDLNCVRNQKVIDAYSRADQMKILAARLKSLNNL